jgi:hypothetical protein
MGVTMFHRILLHFPCSNTYQQTSLGARSALLMGVAPEAIVEQNFFEYRLKYNILHHHAST